jgi:hypothetical protein
VSSRSLPGHALVPPDDFTAAIIPADSERLTTSRGLNVDDYSETIKSMDRAQGLIQLWGDLYHQPFRGLTSDGNVEPGLFKIADEGFEVGGAVAAARELLDGLSDREREQVQFEIDAPEWRDWYNPEWLLNRNGLRLDEASEQSRQHATALMKACFSEAGYIKTAQTRSANLYLGELYDLRHIMNEWSYHLLIFGTPSTTEPWGWNLYGHHLALNVFMVGPQIVVSPTFMGAEPTIIERPNGDSFRLFLEEADDGLALLRSLNPELLRQAIIYEQMKDPAMPGGRWHFADERHLGGAYRDNRVIPYEGVRGDALDAAQRELLLRLSENFISFLPDAPRATRMRQIEQHLDRTWWSWIGGYGDDDPFYYRVQSPVVMLEFDNHTGVWLTNSDPAKYHVHTVVRTPNAGDYGKDLLRQHYEQMAGDPAHGHEHAADSTHHTREHDGDSHSHHNHSHAGHDH